MASAGSPSPSVALWQLPRTRYLARENLLNPFVQHLGAGTLPEASFKSYIAQDAYFLEAFQNAYETGAKCAEAAGLGVLAERFSKLVAGVDEELKMHASYSAELGIDLKAVSPLQATTRYTDFVKVEAAAASAAPGPVTIACLCAALAPCMRLYQWLGSSLAAAGALETAGGMYGKWVKEYSSDDFRGLAEELESLLDACVEKAAAGGETVAGVLTQLESRYLEAMEHELAFFSQQEGVEEAGASTPLLRAAKLVPPRVFIVAGSDSGGGAGIQADMKACAALGAFSTTAIAALTAQNTLGVHGIFPIPIDFVRQQMAVVLEDIGTDVFKTGMLATSDIVACVAAALQEDVAAPERWRRRLVMDPVMVSSSGHVLLERPAIESVKKELFPLATIITPNLHEAKLLLEGRKIETVEAMKQAARDLCALGPRYVLVKGGHLKGVQDAAGASDGKTEATDVLCCAETGECEIFTSKLVSTTHTHGTGCTLASSIAALLARGHTVREAVRGAKEYVSGAIEASAHLQLGAGVQGPMNHCWQTTEW